jgi:hypothetical protein
MSRQRSPRSKESHGAQPPERTQTDHGLDDRPGQHTAFVEQGGEEAAFALVSRVSSLTTAAIHRYRGSVKNFTGDGVLALFGTPVALEDGPLQACRAALEIQKEKHWKA